MNRIKVYRDRSDYIEWFHRHVTCRLFGHKMTVRKMSGLLCKRCRIFEEYSR